MKTRKQGPAEMVGLSPTKDCPGCKLSSHDPFSHTGVCRDTIIGLWNLEQSKMRGLGPIDPGFTEDILFDDIFEMAKYLFEGSFDPNDSDCFNSTVLARECFSAAEAFYQEAKERRESY